MSGLVSQQYQHFIPYWQGSIADYVTALDWSPNGQFLAAPLGLEICAYWMYSSGMLQNWQRVKASRSIVWLFPPMVNFWLLQVNKAG